MIYTQTKTSDNCFIRHFSKDVETIELVWHRDKKDRRINIIEGTGWKIQLDNSLPQELIKGNMILIQKMVFHRLWRGIDDLILEIEESDGF